ncbi:MAG: DUF58 domain-containing protein, partial [Nocardioides sp.]
MLALLLGILPVIALPHLAVAWLWVLIVALLVLADWLLAPRPGALEITREPLASTRLGEATATALRVQHPGRREVRGLLRDAWQPTAGASGNRHRLAIPPGSGTRLVTPLLPRRRGDLHSPGVTVRTL